MEVKSLPRRLFRLPRRKRPKEDRPSNALLTWDAVHTSLELLNDSADACGPLKSAVGGVVALWNLVHRVGECNDNAETLAWRSFTILDTLYQSIDPNEEIPSGLLNQILQFEQLIEEIRVAMEAITKKNRLHRVLHLRRSEAQLAKFTCRLDSADEVFAMHNTTVQTMSLARIRREVKSVSTVACTLELSNIIICDQVQQLKFLQLAVFFLA
ncbi:hypothetical protein K438DRAFT_315317 [Mycena galopus ATCC 62051]|nr:hypothetical protein K438DRAFT_315317 [Mycena galopus ATCC 62051]